MELPFVQEEGIRILFTSDAIYLVFAERIVKKLRKLYGEKFLFVSGKADVPRGLHKYLQEPAPSYISFPKRILEFKHKWEVFRYVLNNIALLIGTSFNSTG